MAMLTWMKAALLCVVMVLSVSGVMAAQPNPGGGMVDVDYFSPSTDPSYGEHLIFCQYSVYISRAAFQSHQADCPQWLRSLHWQENNDSGLNQ